MIELSLHVGRLIEVELVTFPGLIIKSLGLTRTADNNRSIYTFAVISHYFRKDHGLLVEVTYNAIGDYLRISFSHGRILDHYYAAISSETSSWVNYADPGCVNDVIKKLVTGLMQPELWLYPRNTATWGRAFRKIQSYYCTQIVSGLLDSVITGVLP